MSETDGTEADNPNGVEDAVMNMKVQVGDAVFEAVNFSVSMEEKSF